MSGITEQEMFDFGYRWGGMQPLTKSEAQKMWKENREVFLLYPDDTEAAVWSELDFDEHEERGGMFGIEREAI